MEYAKSLSCACVVATVNAKNGFAACARPLAMPNQEQITAKGIAAGWSLRKLTEPAQLRR